MENSYHARDLCPHHYVGKCYIPALFCHGKEDDFVLPHHSQDLFKKVILSKVKIIDSIVCRR